MKFVIAAEGLPYGERSFPEVTPTSRLHPRILGIFGAFGEINESKEGPFAVTEFPEAGVKIKHLP